ncbi:MAG: phosphate acyltransferase PlsX [Clostridia bacterium]|nr:phosphate acyltransferase PlsX [Clostridia bacterium]
MKIIVDAFGGDNAPVEILKGCALAVSEYKANIILTGDEKKLKTAAKENGISLDGMEILHAPDVMEMEDEPTTILKAKSNTSMAVGLKALADGLGDAFVSAGSTGALTVGATFIVKRIKGVKRPAIGMVMPTDNGPAFLMDCGANSECRPEMLHQFAKIGDVYMSAFFGIDRPRVALVNIGTEETKGDELRLEAYKLMKNDGDYNFIGNMEAREFFLGGCDVAVTDGFTGNVMLKLSEGMAKFILNNLKKALTSNLKTMFGALFVKKSVYGLKAKFDYKEYGGAMIVGVKKTVIKAHGSSDARAFKNSIRQAIECVNNDVANRMQKAFEKE